MNKNFMAFSALFALGTCALVAQKKDTISLQEVVVSDTKFSLPKEKSGKVIEKITAKDLERKTGQSLATVLSQVAGIEINGNQSTNGKNLGIYIRGGRNRQVLVIIDGIPASDASGINLEYDLRLLPIEQVESIEILKGASSTLYGTGAATGVINITLKKETNRQLAGNTYVSLGTQNTSQNFQSKAQDLNQGFSIHGNSKKISFYSSLNSNESKGISQANGLNFEEDALSRINMLTKVNYKASEQFSIAFMTQYDRLKVAYDNPFDNLFLMDTDVNNSKTNQVRIGLSPKYKYNKGELVINSSASLSERNHLDFDPWSNENYASKFKSRNIQFDAFNKYSILKNLIIITGAQYQFNDMNAISSYDDISNKNSKFNTIDPYFTTVLNTQFGFNLTSGIRLNMHSNYNSHLVYTINPSFTFKDSGLKIITSYSTAYITPSLYQLYSNFGNLQLKPEENETVEAGFEIKVLKNKASFNMVGFYRNETNFVDFFTNPTTFISNYTNIEGTNNAKGIESSFQINCNDRISIQGNYTYTQVEEKVSRLIPKHKVNTNINYQFNKKGLLNLSYQFVDARKDAYFDANTFTTNSVKLDSYQLLNGLVNFDVIKNRMKIWCAVTNIFNEQFEENFHFSSLGRNVKIGTNIMF